jgi:hypothetical protein
MPDALWDTAGDDVYLRPPLAFIRAIRARIADIDDGAQSKRIVCFIGEPVCYKECHG